MTGFEATPVVDETITIADVESMAPSSDGAQWYKNRYLLGGAAVAAAYLATR
jgi:hypothetical protein